MDSFATPCPTEPVPTVSDLDRGFWAQGMAMCTHHALSPWVGLVDRPRYAAEVNRVRALGMTTIATAHSPVITPASMDEAFALLRDIPDAPVPPAPDQNVLDTILAAVG